MIYTLTNAIGFILGIIISLYLTAFMVRFIFAQVGGNFRNPIMQSIVMVTDPLLVPARRYIPSVGNIDTASIVVMLIVKVVGLWLVWMIQGSFKGGFLLLTISIIQLVQLAVGIYMFAIFVQVIASWIVPAHYQYENPVLAILRTITEPVMRPVRRLIPPIGVIDLSPMLVLLVLYVLWNVLQAMQH